MADITLKAYLAHLDDLLARRQYEEAEAHCKHILAKYPRNLSALKRLAKAQSEAGNFDVAEATYSTVLSMDPRSAEAYVGLSWGARQRGQGDQTIALLERAYEQDTTDQDVVQLLHDAQRTFNDRNNAKLPQTQYIAARQQFRSGLAQQAVATLNGALAADPARADIRLLKMQIHQQSGDGMEAARAATDVLKQLPDCVDANKMLAEFWKAQGRPSDAQRFVTRVEAAEPYLAFEIATGSVPADETLTLSLLNVRSAPSDATSTAQPDWMGTLGMSEPTEMSMPKVDSGDVSWLDNAQPVIEDDSEKIDQSWLAGVTDMPEDLNWLTDAAAAPTNDGESDDDFEFPLEFSDSQANAPLPPSLAMDWMADAPPVDDGDTLDSISTKMAREEVKSAQVLDELAALSVDPDKIEHGDTPGFLTGEPAQSEEDWMSTLDIAATDPTTPDRQDFDDFLKNFTNFGDLSPETVSQSSKSGLTGQLSALSSSDEDNGELAPVSPDVADIDPEDPLAWMRAGVGEDEGMLFTVDDAMPDLDALTGEMDPLEEARAAAQASAVSDVTMEDNDAPDPFAWMQEHDVELVDAVKAPSLWDDPMGVEQEQSLDQAEVDPLAWMADAGITLDDEEEVDPESDPLAWAKESGVDLLEDVGTANFKQTATLSAEMAELGAQADDRLFADEKLFDEEPAAEESAAKSGLLAFMKPEGAGQEGDGSMSEKDLPDWLGGADDEDDAAKPAASGDLADFDWMAVVPSDNDSDIDWDAVPDDAAAADEPAPDWLASLENPVDAAEAAALSDKDDPNIKDLWDDTADDIATPEWMASLRDENAAEEPAGAAEDWMFTQGEAAKDEIDGASEDLLAVAKDEIAAAGDAALDFGADVESAVPVDAESDLDGAMNWLNDSVPADDPLTPVASDEAAPDWLVSAAPEAAAEPAAADDGGLDWLSAAAPETVEEEPAAAAESELDWLADAAPAATAALSTEEAVADLDWMSSLEADASGAENDELPAAVSALPEDVGDLEDDDGAMDWLNAATDEEPEAVADAPLGWLEDDDDGGDQTNAFIAHDSLDWLSGAAESGAAADDADRSVSPEFLGAAADDFEFGAPDEAAAQPSYELSFLEDEESTADVATVELEGDPLPDWLMESKSGNAASGLDVDVPQSQLNVQSELSGEILDDADLLEAEPPLQESLNASAVNSPDWLNAMVPGMEIGGDLPDEDEPVEDEFLNGGRSDFAWLSAVVDEELAPPAMAAPSRRQSRYPFSEPPSWLATLREITQAAAPVTDLDSEDENLPDWLKFDDAEAN